jgi:hypothetical protein
MEQTKRGSFSYLDGFFFLLAALVLSLGIYLFAEARREERERPTYRVEVELCMEEFLLVGAPQAGDVLFDTQGAPWGEVISVTNPEETGPVFMVCRMTGEVPQVGETFPVETKNLLHEGTVTGLAAWSTAENEVVQ